MPDETLGILAKILKYIYRGKPGAFQTKIAKIYKVLFRTTKAHKL